MKIQLTSNSAHELRDSLVVLYTLKMDRLMDERSRWVNPTPATKPLYDKLTAKIELINFLIEELEEVEII